MKLLTAAIEKKFEKFPLYSQEGKGEDAKVIVKFFGGAACTWLIIEGTKQPNGDYTMFGYVTFDGVNWEWGYVSLNELQKLRFRPFGLGVERDKYFKAKTIKEAVA